VVFPPFTFATSSAAAHDGSAGLVNHNGSDWIYRDDAAAQVREGDTISAWVQFHTVADGRAYFAFGANSNLDGSPLATYSLVLAADTRKLYIQENFFASPLNSTIGTSSQNTKFQANHWYRIEVTWGTDGSIVGKLFDSNGTTLLNSVRATASLFSSGGIGFHATGHDKYWDTVTAVASAGGAAGPRVLAGHGSSVVLGTVIQSDLATPSSPPRFIRLSETGTTGPGGEFRAALSGDLDLQALLVLLERAEKQRGQAHQGGGVGQHAAGPWAVAWATLQAVADALPAGSLDLASNVER
jgi:hypothetical protein